LSTSISKINSEEIRQQFAGVMRMIPVQRIKTEKNYSIALGDEIIELIERTQNKNLLYREVLDILGNHESIVLKLDELLYTNRILKIPIKVGNVKDYVLTIPKKKETGWMTMVCPCFTCDRNSECSVNNPVNPVSCRLFNEWLIEEDESKKIQPFKFIEYDILDDDDNIKIPLK
jgi:hypothetical protein